MTAPDLLDAHGRRWLAVPGGYRSDEKNGPVRSRERIERRNGPVREVVVQAAESKPAWQWAVMVGEDTEDEAPTELHLYDDPADAHELAQHVPGAWIARRRVVVGEWEPDPDADPNPFDDPFRLLLADRDRLAAELAHLRSRVSNWATMVRTLASHSIASPSAKDGAVWMADRMAEATADTESNVNLADRSGSDHKAEKSPPEPDGTRIDGDLVQHAVLDSLPGYMTQAEMERIADCTLGALVAMDGVTVLRGVDLQPWTPDGEEA